MNNNPLILIVEDDNHIKNLISTTLKVNKYNYLVASSGNEAIMLAVSHKPDIILLDLGLPDMDGVEIIKNVREWSNIKIEIQLSCFLL